ncbi:hypothetical protein MKZ02_21055 [Pseudobacillus sp. FSL P4-0506]|uniref:hypothetical protein n=1 Tax=Pseudobacillus sp. FSL P4-0506 TaxID=2921576 RepID=UPI0030FBA846
MRVTICRGQKSLVRVEKEGRIGYFTAGRHVSDRKITELATGNYVKWRMMG